MDKCGASSRPFCTDPSTPEGFCCSRDSYCILAAANTTVICCPRGRDCHKIQTVPCMLDLMVPPSDFQTTVLQGQLPRCGNNCCPWGFHCDENNICVMDQDQSIPPPDASVSSGTGTSESPTPTHSSSFITSGTSSATSAPTVTVYIDPAPDNQTGESSGTDINTGQIIGLSVGSVVGIVLITALLYFICRLRRSTKADADADADADAGDH
ncbi:hypothetical protein AAE478_003357 [Parahypoxylon ruwenzoriense]